MSSLIAIAGPTIQNIISRTKTRSMKMGDLRTAHARAMLYIEKWIQKNFKAQGALAMDGPQWVPLKAATIARRRHGGRKGGQAQILQDTGWLKNRWKPFYSPMKVAYQSMVDYGIYHDSDAPRGKLPQRRIIPRQRQVKGDLRGIYLRHIKEVLSGRAE
jgi:hypothetical protein